MQGIFNISRSINVIWQTNRSKNKGHMATSRDKEKCFDKIQHHFLIKALVKPGIERMYFNIITVVYDKLIPNSILKSEMRQGRLLSQLSLNIML
jgi:hypothetical protein